MNKLLKVTMFWWSDYTDILYFLCTSVFFPVSIYYFYNQEKKSFLKFLLLHNDFDFWFMVKIIFHESYERHYGFLIGLFTFDQARKQIDEFFSST